MQLTSLSALQFKLKLKISVN